MSEYRHPLSPLLDHCPEGLPAQAYLDAGWYAQEQQTIWARNWVCAGRLNDLAHGSMKPVQVGAASVILCRGEDGALSSRPIAVDYAANARSLGLKVHTADTLAEVRTALTEAQDSAETTVIVIHTDPQAKVGGYESWWDVPPAEVSTIESVKAARLAYDEAKKKERWHL